jgi:cytochrome o ubiquinol oxidase subunit IV
MQANQHGQSPIHAGTVKSYAAGFGLSALLTAIAFGLAMAGALSHGALVFAILACAVAQIVVQLRYFLHLDRSEAMYWNLMSLLFTFFIIFLFVGGSVWIMYSMHDRM